jgi:hypothetical protein
MTRRAKPEVEVVSARFQSVGHLLGNSTIVSARDAKKVPRRLYQSRKTGRIRDPSGFL